MSKYIFLDQEILTRSLIIIVILFVLGFFKSAITLTLICLIVFSLFRRKDINLLELRSIGRNIILAPFTGYFKEFKNSDNAQTELLFKVGLLDGYGIYFPTIAEVEDVIESKEVSTLFGFLNCYFYKTEVTFKNKLNETFQIQICSRLFFPKPHVFLQVGDKGTLGALLGYIPFGGKVVLSLKGIDSLQIQPGKRVASCQTVIANLKE